MRQSRSCMYVCMYVCMYGMYDMYVYVYMYVYMYVYVCMYVCPSIQLTQYNYMHSKYEDNIKTIKERTDLLRLSATGDGLVCVHKSLASTVLCMVTVITH